MSALEARRLRQELESASTPEVIIASPEPVPTTIKTKQIRKPPFHRPSSQNGITNAKKKYKPEEPVEPLDADNMFSLLRNPISFFNNTITSDQPSDVEMEELEDQATRTPPAPPVEVKLSNFEPTETNTVRGVKEITFGLLRGEVGCTVAIAHHH